MPFHVSEWFEKVRSEDRQKVMEVCDNAFNVYQGVRDVRDSPLHADWQWCRPGQDPAWCYGQLHPFGEGFVGLLTVSRHCYMYVTHKLTVLCRTLRRRSASMSRI